jgi:hypothetical protein
VTFSSRLEFSAGCTRVPESLSISTIRVRVVRISFSRYRCRAPVESAGISGPPTGVLDLKRTNGDTIRDARSVSRWSLRRRRSWMVRRRSTTVITTARMPSEIPRIAPLDKACLKAEHECQRGHTNDMMTYLWILATAASVCWGWGEVVG